jgi:hypothetical protein
LSVEWQYKLSQNDDPGGRRRSHDGKMLVAGAVEIVGNAPGRIRLAAIERRAFDLLAIKPAP